MVLYHPFGILPASSPMNLFYFDIWMKVYINWLLFIDKLICVRPVTVAESHCNSKTLGNFFYQSILQSSEDFMIVSPYLQNFRDGTDVKCIVYGISM